MRIDWANGWWQVYDVQNGALLGRFRSIRISANCELVNTDGGRHGWLVTCGKLTTRGETALIEQGG